MPMRSRVLSRFLAPAAIAIAAGAAPAQSSPADSAAIHAQSRRFSAAYVAGDVDTMMDVYAADAVIFPERAEMLGAPETIRRYWTRRPGNRVTRHVATPTRIVIQDDLAYDYGVYEVAGERDGQPWGPAGGKYVIVWVRGADGAWRMRLDIWNARSAATP